MSNTISLYLYLTNTCNAALVVCLTDHHDLLPGVISPPSCCDGQIVSNPYGCKSLDKKNRTCMIIYYCF